jgi:AraC family transcriptional regulator
MAEPQSDTTAKRVELRSARIGAFSFSEGIHPGDSIIPWHWHPHPTICCVLEGGFTEIAAGSTVSCAPATVKFMPAGERHWDRFDHGAARGLLVEVAVGEVPALHPYASVLEQRIHYQGGEVAELAFRLHRELSRMDNSAALAIEGLMLELLAHASLRPESSDRVLTARWLVEARDIIEAGLGGHLGVTAVAAVVGVHPVTLARGFRRCFGCTMGEYVRHRRLDRAMRQLRSSHDSLGAIAAANGFADQSHFSNLFRRKVGITPSRYRRLAASS